MSSRISEDRDRPIVVRGAREHNLCGIDLDIPRHRLVVITGVSGSGKSSLAFDTIYREGQRRYLETLSPYARQQLGKLARPAAARLEGLAAALSVDQRTVSGSSRSTVGTVTELYSYLRLLFARVGEAHCASCGARLTEATPARIAEAIAERFGDGPVTLLAPIIEGHRGAYRKQLELLAREVSQLRVDGEMVAAKPPPTLDAAIRHQIDVVIDRIERPRSDSTRLNHAVSEALQRGQGQLRALRDDATEGRFSQQQACLACGAPTRPIGPRLFSFNSPFGACPSCQGLGLQDCIDPELLVADASRTVRQGALTLSTPNGYLIYSQVTIDVLDQVCRAHGFSVDIAWKDLTDAQRAVILDGSDRIKIPFGKHTLASRMRWTGITARPREEGFYKGIVPVMNEILHNKRNKNILRYARTSCCSACGGARLRPEARAVRLRGQNIAELAGLPIDDLRCFLADELPRAAEQAAAISTINDEALPRLDLLSRLGLSYLQLDRRTSSLSGGEARRLRLATQVHGGLAGLLYVLDEPSVGLHSRDTAQLLETLVQLRDQGNSVLVVEHDVETIRAADWVVDIGPGPGSEGGRLLFDGPLSAMTDSSSPTAEYLTGRREMTVSARRSRRSGRASLWIRGATARNLRDIDVELRLGALNAVTGVAGSGKSTLIDETLARVLRARLHKAIQRPGGHRAIEGAELIDKVIVIDQAPIGRTPRSNTATYTKLYDRVRTLFAQQPEAKKRGWDAGRFSFNVEGGRCERCGGAGVELVGMHYLSDVEVRCAACDGRRFNDDTLEVHYRGHSVADVLAMPVRQAAGVFGDHRTIARLLEALQGVGLDYLPLGQPATTLSGGEAQRVKLATELGRPAKGHTLYILDEPTVGLHLADVDQLLITLDGLVERGNTVVVIEHDLSLIARVDWVADLGPGGGVAGGQLVGTGTPEQIMQLPGSFTGAALAAMTSYHDQGGADVAVPKQSDVSAIEMRGVRTHNLRDIDVNIPHGALTVITGVSGSGKSSLAIDTLAAEGQRRYTECLSSHARQLLERRPRPEVDAIAGLTPIVALAQQRRAPKNPRSTVSTIAGLREDLRLIWSRASQPHCPRCDGRLEPAGALVRCSSCEEAAYRWPLSAAAFSFNHHQGACGTCDGLGATPRCDAERLVTAPNRSLLDGAISGGRARDYFGEARSRHVAILEAVGRALAIDFGCPFNELDARARAIALYGTGAAEYDVQWRYERGKRRGEHSFRSSWEGFCSAVEQEYALKLTGRRADDFLELIGDAPCSECGGSRLKPAAGVARFAGLRISELEARSIDAVLRSLRAAEASLDARAAAITASPLARIFERLAALVEVGLGYLHLDRITGTLSAGELQRLRLATQIGAGLTEATYVLDEPTVGLHARDTERLCGVIRRLCAAGNTTVIVEHDPAVIGEADHVIEIGPGAAADGGRVVASGPPNPVGVELRRTSRPERELSPGFFISRARANNLRELDLQIPAGGLIAVTGVSGAGKTSLVFDLIAASARADAAVGCAAISGLDRFAAIVEVDDRPPVGSSSTPVTMLGAPFDAIRTRFAATKAARLRNLTKRHFALGTKGGRCEACRGSGQSKVDLGFLAAVTTPCDQCGGQRYGDDVLACRLRTQAGELSIAEVLALTVAEARGALTDLPPAKVDRPLACLQKVGLGYLPLGQSIATLSGGEARRLHLAAELARAATDGAKLYLLDEPTVGLHRSDVAQLISVLHELVDAGHTVIVVEHHLDVIGAADWIVDLGPEGGDGGGALVACGTPAMLVQDQTSYTAAALRSCC